MFKVIFIFLAISFWPSPSFAEFNADSEDSKSSAHQGQKGDTQSYLTRCLDSAAAMISDRVRAGDSSMKSAIDNPTAHPTVLRFVQICSRNSILGTSEPSRAALLKMLQEKHPKQHLTLDSIVPTVLNGQTPTS
jgi:hypothetical protein